MAVFMGVYYRQPEDADQFEKRYLNEHLPLVRAYDNIKSVRLFKTSRKIMGEFPYAYAFVGRWDDKDGWKADMNSPKAAEATRNAQEFAPPFDVVVFEEMS